EEAHPLVEGQLPELRIGDGQVLGHLGILLHVRRPCTGKRRSNRLRTGPDPPPMPRRAEGRLRQEEGTDRRIVGDRDRRRHDPREQPGSMGLSGPAEDRIMAHMTTPKLSKRSTKLADAVTAIARPALEPDESVSIAVGVMPKGAVGGIAAGSVGGA